MTHTPAPWQVKENEIQTVASYDQFGPRLDPNTNDPPGTATLRRHPEGGEMKYGHWPDTICEMANDRPELEHEPNLALLAIAPTAPHECDPECPGDRYRRKLALFEELVEGITGWVAHRDFDSLAEGVYDEARVLLARAREIEVVS